MKNSLESSLSELLLLLGSSSMKETDSVAVDLERRGMVLLDYVYFGDVMLFSIVLILIFLSS